MTSEETLRRAILNDEFPNSDEFFKSDSMAQMVPDRLKFERKAALGAWMTLTSGRNVNANAPDWQANKDALVRGFFKDSAASNVSDETVHDLIRSHIQTSDNATDIALNSALTGRPLAQTLNEVQALAGVSKTRGIRDRYVSAASSLYSDIAAKRNVYSDVINKVSGSLGEMLKKADTDIGMTDVFNDAAERLIGVPAEDRRLVIEAIAATGNATAEERSSYLSKFEWRVNRMAETLGAASVSNLSNALESVLDLAAFGSGLADPRDVAGAAPEGNKSRELSLLAQQIRTAANEKLDPIKSNSWIGKQGLALADMATQSGVALVNPLAGFAVNLAYFNDTMGADAMTQNPGMTVEQADKITAIGAPVNAAIETITALIPFGKIKLPFVQKWLMAETASVGGALRNFGIRAGFGTATEIGEEIAQAYVPLKIQELMGAMGQDMPAVDWERNMPKFADIAAEVWAPALVFSIVGAGAASINDINNGRRLASDLDLLVARGIAPETAAKIKEASDLGDYNKVDSLFREEFVSETKASKPDIQAATERLKARFRDQSSIDVLQDATSPEYTAKVIRTATGWQVQTGDGNVITTETKEAADQIYSKIRQVGNQKEAEVMAEILDGFYSGGMGKGAQVEMTGETTMAQEIKAGEGRVFAERRDASGGLISQRQFGPQALETVRAEAEAAGIQTDTRGIFARINGSNEVFPQQVGDTAKGIWRILSLFESRKNATPQVATLLHEDIESKFTLGLINKSWTVGDIQKAFAALLPAFANITAPIVQTDEQIAKMSKSAQEAYYAKQSEFNWINNVRNIVDGKFDAATLRETFSEMYVRDRFALDRKGLPTGLPAGLISRGIEASIMGATTQEEAGIYKRFRAMFKAFSAHFKAVFKTVQTMVAARKEGKIGEDWDSFVNKVLGIDEVKQMESQAVDEVKAMLGIDEEVQAVIDAGNMAFSISPANSQFRFEGIAKEDPIHDGSRVGTAWQGKVKPTTQDTNDSIDTVEPKELEKQMGKLTQFIEGVPLPKYLTEFTDPVKKMREFIAFQKANLLALYDAFEKLSSDYVVRSTHWYDGARLIAERVSNSYGLTVEQSSAIIAVFSPMKDWFQNVAMGQRFADIMANHKDTPITENGMKAAIQEMLNAAENQTYLRDALNLIEGRSISNLLKDKSKGGQKLAAVAVRLMSTHVHGLTHDVLSPEGDSLGIRKNLDGSNKKMVWQSYPFIEKALSIYENGSLENISKTLGTEHKIRNFYNNIIAPTSPRGDATVDTHAVNAAVLFPMGGSAYLPTLNFGDAGMAGGGNSGIYWLFHEALREAAAERNVMPRQMQSITWEAIRGLFTDTLKRDKKFVAKIIEIWESSPNAESARNQILKLGITAPEWARMDASNIGSKAGMGGDIGQTIDSTRSVQSGVRQGRKSRASGANVAGPTFSISPAQDAEYLAAAKAGDTETAQRLVNAAKEIYEKTIARKLIPLRTVPERLSGKIKPEDIPALQKIALKIKERAKLRANVHSGSSGYSWSAIDKRTDTINTALGNLFSKVRDESGTRDIDVAEQWLEDSWRSQIKSADPITYDDAGNIIPLSQRFNQASPDIRFSISPIRNLNELSDQVERQFAENPVKALEVKSRMIRQFAKISDKWSNERWTPQGNKIRPISEKRTVKSLDKEQAMRQATLEGEKIAANMEPKQALQQAKAEAQAWRDETDATQKEDWSPRESLVRDLITLEAIVAMFPQEIRGKIGGFVALARKASEAARLKVLQKQLERGQVLLEKHLKEQYGTATEELLKRFKSQKDASGRITGKIISTATEQVDYAAEFIKLSIEEQADRQAALEKKVEESEDTNEVQDALTKLGIARLFDMWSDKDSAARESAFNWLNDTIEAGKLGKSIMDEARKEMLTEMRQSAQSSILQGDELNPDIADNITNLNKGVFKRALLNLRGMLSEALWTTIQRLELIFGEDSKIVNHFAEKIINAANLSTDIKRLVEAQKKDALSIIFNSDSKYAHARGIAELQKMKKSGISTRRVKKEEIKLDLETLTKLNDGTMTAEAAGLRQDEVDAALEEFAANARKSTVTIERVVNAGTPVERMMSETQGIQWWLWSMQDASRKQMERDGWDADSFKQLEEFLSPEAKALGRWISGSYQDAAGMIDPIYRKLFNAPLPRTKNYSPIHRRNMNTGGDIMDIDGSDMNSGLAAGFTKARVNTTASLVEMDALAVFLAHWENVSHWVSHAELMRDMKAVLLDKDTAVAIRQKKSEGYLQRLKDDVKTIEKNGTNSANELVNISRVWRWFMQYRSYKGLAFRLSPIIKQTPALLNPLLADVPAHNYMMGMARAFIEPQTFAKEVSAMWSSDIIRRRIESGFSAESRVAMQGAGMTGSQAIVAMQAGMVPMGMVDGGWTALGAAISFDYYRRGYMRDNPQMTPEIADAKAIARVEKMIATSAQPSDVYARSLSERSGNPFMKSMSMFVSDQRKALAIELMAIRRLATGKSKDVTLDIQRAVVAHVVQAGVSQVMAVVIASLLGDDEDRDRELSAEQWTLALALGPVNGLFVFGRLIDKIGRGLLGLRVFPADDLASKVANDLLKGGKNMDDLFNPDDSDDFMDALDSASTAVGAGMSAAIGPVGGVIDVGANVAREARKIAKRLADQ